MKTDRLRPFLEWLKDIFFPLRCPFCGRVIDRSADCCDSCRARLPRVNWAEVCPRCGKHSCVCGVVPLISMTCPVFYYEDPARFAVRQLKFAHHPGTAFSLGRLMADALKEKGGEWDLIVPVPMTGKKLRKRGYNQSELLSRAIAERMGIPAVSALKKIRETKEQHTLGAMERSHNLTGSYEADENLVQGKRVLLCDDVLTTGSTLREAAAALLRAGAVDVGAVALCSVRGERS